MLAALLLATLPHSPVPEDTVLVLELQHVYGVGPCDTCLHRFDQWIVWDYEPPGVPPGVYVRAWFYAGRERPIKRNGWWLLVLNDKMHVRKHGHLHVGHKGTLRCIRARVFSESWTCDDSETADRHRCRRNWRYPLTNARIP